MIIKDLIQAKYVDRPNRFTVIFEKDGINQIAHLRDPGRLKELLIPNSSLLIRKASNPTNRKTKHDVIAILSEQRWVLINSGFHSDLAEELIKGGIIPELRNFHVQKREYTYGKSRIDFLLGDGHKKMLMEVKGCTYVEDSHAKFPDAPTERGKKHVEELIHAKKTGLDASILFLIIRDDAQSFSPNWDTDPHFSESLKDAAEKGVKILTCSFKNVLFKDKLTITPFKTVKLRINP